jgi:cation:H+ antiporter
MMIQATVPSGLGLLFTDWRLDHALLWSGATPWQPSPTCS